MPDPVKPMDPAGAEDGIPEIPELKETLRKMREYRDDMEDRLGSYSYALHPWQDRDHGWESSESPRLDRRNDPQLLWLDIEQALERQPSENRPRSLILMEGMDARIAEVLSVKFGIPHEFWTAHYLPETQLRLINPSGFDSTDSTYWKIGAPSQLSVIWDEMPDEFGHWYFTAYCGGCPRGDEILLTSGSTLLNLSLAISFWGKYTPYGWIALVLMDVPDGCLLPEGEPDPVIPSPRGLAKVGESQIAISTTNCYTISESKTSINRCIYPCQLSLWDANVQACENEKIITTDDPFSASIIIRNFVFWKREDQITASWNLNQTVWTSSPVETQKALDIKSPNFLIERSRTIAADYQTLRRSRQLLQQSAFQVRQIYEAFRCDDTHYLASQTIETLRIQISKESRRWSHLQDHMKVLDELISGNMTMFAQRAAMDEAFATRIQAHDSYTQTKAANEQAAAANRTARSSGQLAKIATVAVPCTVAASILSMNGDFAVGEPLFYVYWCVAMPLTIVLLGWVVQKDVQAWRDKLVKKAKRESGEKDVESSRNSGYYSD
ncbi:magnesium cobalt transport [Fusarium denticulatum]|uniref:Magnesium cobalt transport n=1 Tax=Fusarium denticulatum TaxID=48507 RepID=A0A8H5TZ54_9HYPO|nr:magnesium cobalt transport [Fusarium denticulatum]